MSKRTAKQNLWQFAVWCVLRALFCPLFAIRRRHTLTHTAQGEHVIGVEGTNNKNYK